MKLRIDYVDARSRADRDLAMLRSYYPLALWWTDGEYDHFSGAVAGLREFCHRVASKQQWVNDMMRSLPDDHVDSIMRLRSIYVLTDRLSRLAHWQFTCDCRRKYHWLIYYVYFLMSEFECIKIGHSCQPTIRGTTVSHESNGIPMRMLAAHPGCKHSEKAVHRAFDAHRLYGQLGHQTLEWFSPSDSLMRYIESLNDYDSIHECRPIIPDVKRFRLSVPQSNST